MAPSLCVPLHNGQDPAPAVACAEAVLSTLDAEPLNFNNMNKQQKVQRQHLETLVQSPARSDASDGDQGVLKAPSPPLSPAVPPPVVPLHRPPSMCAAAAVAATPSASRGGATPSVSAGAAATVDWSRVRLGVDAAPTMFVATWSPETGRWSGGELLPYGPLNLLPAAQVLNYGQSIFEGMKAYRCCDGGDSSDAAAATTGSGRVRLFRPDANGARFAAGAVRMCMPPVPQAIFLAAVHAVVRANVAWVPPAAKGSLYVRPLLLGTGPLLGLCPAPSYTFVVYAVPVGSRAKGGRLASLDFLIHDSLHRAAPRGVGSTKAAGNYSPCLRAQADAREAGCQDCIYLDARSDTYLEEGSGCNIFTTHGSLVTTPPAAGSILPGITRASLLQLAVVLGYSVREAPITVQDAMKADEMFASGTAMVVQPIGSITYKGRRVQFCRHATTTNGATTNGAATNGATTNGAATNGAIVNATGESDNPANCHSLDEHSDGNGKINRYSNDHASGNGCTAGSNGEAGEVAGSDGGGGVPISCVFGGKTAADLMAEDRAALAASAPVPEPGSLAPGVGPVTQRLYSLLTSIQYGRAPDPFEWMIEVDMRGPTEGALHLDQLLDVDEAVGGTERVSEPTLAACNEAQGDPAKGPTPGGAGQPLPRSVFADPNLE